MRQDKSSIPTVQVTMTGRASHGSHGTPPTKESPQIVNEVEWSTQERRQEVTHRLQLLPQISQPGIQLWDYYRIPHQLHRQDLWIWKRHWSSTQGIRVSRSWLLEANHASQCHLGNDPAVAKAQRAFVNKQFEIEFKSQNDDYHIRRWTLDNNKPKAFAFLWEQCTKGMKNKIESRTNYATSIQQDPIQLAIEGNQGTCSQLSRAACATST